MSDAAVDRPMEYDPAKYQNTSVPAGSSHRASVRPLVVVSYRGAAVASDHPSGRASRSCIRELMPSLVNTWWRWYSTVLGLR